MRTRGTSTVLALVVALVGALVGALSLAACGTDGPALEEEAAWRISSEPVDTTGPVWAARSTVHLADGTTIDTGDPVRAFVVAGDGVFFVASESPEDVGSTSFTDEDLMFAAPGATPTSTGLSVAGTGVRASPDGRHLAVLDADRDSGEATMRIFDLRSGEQVVSEDGMDTSDIDDPVHNLLEMEVEIDGITDEQVGARVINGDHVYDLATGEGRPLGDEEEPPGAGGDPMQSPDGAWRIEQDESRDTVTSARGDEVTPQPGTGRWSLFGWLDADTVLGVAVDEVGRESDAGGDHALTLMTCAIPAGTCELLTETTGERVAFPLGTLPTTGMSLGTAGGQG